MPLRRDLVFGEAFRYSAMGIFVTMVGSFSLVRAACTCGARAVLPCARSRGGGALALPEALVHGFCMLLCRAAVLVLVNDIVRDISQEHRGERQ